MVLNSPKRKIRVLLVDDDEDDFYIIRKLFASMKETDCILDWASSSDEAIAVIAKARHDVYIIDYRLDARTGLDVLQEVGAINRTEPFILLTGVGDQGVERESLQLAASDYIVKKSLTSDSLARAIYYALGRKEQERQKIDQLLELNRTKDEFISIASHQLRTPATTVKQYVGMLVDGFAGELTGQQQKLLDKAYDSNERQLTIINDLLKVAQVDAGGMNVTLRTADLSGLMQEIINDFSPLYEEVGQTITADIPDDVPVVTDENALRMVIDNLLENAKKYSEPGATTRVTLQNTAAGIMISVSDEGVGVDEPERLFQKFSRISNKLSTAVGGTGLGLYWAKSVTELIHGSLTYKRNRKHGSTFTITLPNVK